MSKPPIAMVDFGEAEGDLIPWLIESHLPAVTDLVIMMDEDGNACLGTVADLDEENRMAMLAPDWETWIPAGTPLEVRTPLSQGSALGRFVTSLPNLTGGSPGSISPTAKISYA